MLEKQEDQKIERLVRCMFKAELSEMENREGAQKPIAFSDAFERGMQRLIRSQRRNYQIKAAVRYVLSAAAVLLLLLCLANPGYIAKAWDVLVKWHSTHLEIDMPDAEWTEALPEYEMTYIPEGFVLTMKDCDEFGGLMLYENGDNYFRFSYALTGGNYKYDNEHSEISVIEDKEGNTVLFIQYEEGGYSMLWNSKDGILFSLYAFIDEEELLKIKDGIKIKNKNFLENL